MKRFIFLILVVMISGCFNNSFSQGFYVGIDAGYALKAAPQSASNGIDADHYELYTYSYGKGFDFGAIAGYMINKNIGVELGVSYLIGAKAVHTYKSSSSNFEFSTQGKMLRLVPSFVVAAGFEKINPYAKLGAIIGVAGKLTSENTATAYDDKSSADNVVFRKQEATGGVAFGFSGALGADYNLSEKFAIFAEINLECLSYAPEKGKVTEWTFNGVDQLVDAETFQKETEYVKVIDENEPQDPSKPTKILRSNEPFSSIGLNLGVKIKL